MQKNAELTLFGSLTFNEMFGDNQNCKGGGEEFIVLYKQMTSQRYLFCAPYKLMLGNFKSTQILQFTHIFFHESLRKRHGVNSLLKQISFQQHSQPSFFFSDNRPNKVTLNTCY